MGELLSFPDRRSDSPGESFEGPEDGAAPRAAPSSRPRRGQALDPKVREDLDEVERRFGLAARARSGGPPVDEARVDEARVDEARVDEARWAVPGVDDHASAAPEPTRTSRRAENVAMATLTRHDASEGEVRAKLVARGLDADDVEAELARLRSTGLLDDSAFAARLVENLRQRKGLGDSAIRSTLRGRLVPPAVVDAVLVERAEDDETAEARLHEVADDRARRLTSLGYAVAERRLTAYLMRKGYGGSAVRTAARSALERAGIH